MPPPTRLITAALPYCNAEPHLGNLIGSTLSADVFARYCRANGEPTLFVCGTDRYGTATEIKAWEEHTTPAEVCAKYHALHEAVYRFFDLSFDHFGSTETAAHAALTHEIVDHLEQRDCLVTKPTVTCHCTACQRALADRFVQGECPHCHSPDARGDQCDACGHLTHATTLLQPRCALCQNTTLEFPVTPHQFLKLDRAQAEVKAWLTSDHTDPHAYALTRARLADPLPAKDITRNLTWGVPVPERFHLPHQVYYVWFEAPLGYISLTAAATPHWRQLWTDPNTRLYHFIGKDNILFHTLYFPATLLGSGQGWILPHYISATHYLLFEGQKFSKRRNVGVFGTDAMNSGIEADVWRLALLRLRPETGDADFTMQFLLDTREWLRKNVANLLSRVTSFAAKQMGGVVPSAAAGLDAGFRAQILPFVEQYRLAMGRVHLRSGVEWAMKAVNETNAYLNRVQLSRQAPNASQIVFTAVNALALLSVLWAPFTPRLAEKMREQLGHAYLWAWGDAADLFPVRVPADTRLPPPYHLLDKK